MAARAERGQLSEPGREIYSLLYEGRPLAAALAVAIARAAPHERIALRSDAEGQVLLPLPRSGPWLLKAVPMRPDPPGSGADGESLWASLSFSSGIRP